MVIVSGERVIGLRAVPARGGVDASDPPRHRADMSTLTDLDPKELRPLLHAEIDRLKDEDLAAAHRALLEIEMHRLLGETDEATDRAWASGEITEEKIAEAIREHRRKHPYR